MKSKQEKALVILEALEQADESLVQQALDVDNAEKFRSLGPVRLARNERPGKARLGLIAACLALVITLAAFPWLLSKLPVYNRPTEPTEPPIPPTTGFTEEYDPSEPPQLLVFNSSTSLFPIITGYDWYCDRDWENIVDISSPWINPLSRELEGQIPWITTKESGLQLRFEWADDSIHVRCWPAEKFGDPDAYETAETVTVMSGIITLKTGRYIYEVTAQWYNSYWGRGTATYVFGAESSFVITEPNTDIQILCGDMVLGSIAGGLNTGRRYDDVAKKWMEVSGVDGWWIMRDAVMNGTPLPTMTLTQDLQIKLGPNGTLDNILVYFKHTESTPGLKMTTQDPAELSTLPPGRWHILLKVTWQGRYIAQEADCEVYQYEYVFVLDIPEPEVPAFVWNFDESSGTLTVGGCQVLQDFTYNDRWTTPPWESHREDVRHIVVADGVTRIGNYAFYDMPNLQSVTLPGSLKEIGDFAFQGAENLTDITFPASLEKIGDYAFDDCRHLPEILLPEGLQSIGQDAFRFCKLPESLTIPASVTFIGIGAFRYWDSLQEVTMLGSPETMRYTFEGCKALKLIRFCGDAPNSLEEITHDGPVICYYPMDNATWTEEILDTANLYYTVWFATEDPLTAQLPENATSGQCGRTAYWELKDGTLTISGTGDVTYLGWENFRSDIRKVIIKDGITNIPNSAFYQCGNLTSVTIPQSVTFIGSNAFNQCKKLGAVTLPENLEFMGGYAFEHCEALEEIVFPEGMTEIPNGAFLGCKSLKSITWPSNLTRVGQAAFQNCTSLKEVHFPASLSSLGDYSFAGCKNLKKIYFYGDVPGAGNFTFDGVTGTIYYPPGNVSWISGGIGHTGGNIGQKPDPNQPNQGCITHDFGDWVVLKEPTRLEGGKQERVCKACGYTETEGLPPIVWEGEQPTHPELGEPIASGKQHNVKWNLYADGTLTVFGVRLMEGSNTHRYAWHDYSDQITRIIVEEGLAKIASYAFRDLPNLVSVSLPNTLMRIENEAFLGCPKLESLVIPASVVEIQNFAFGRCSNLRQVYFLGDAPDMPNNIFNMDTLHVYIPANNKTWIGRKWDYGGLITWVERDFGAGYPLQLTAEPKRRA